MSIKFSGKKTLVFIVSLVLITICSSWGFLAHKTAHQLAIYQQPKSLRSFLYKNIDYLEYNSVRPDVRRNEDSTEATKHFIDIEMYGPDAINNMPLSWNDAVKKYSKDTLLTYGYVPYYVIHMQQLLTNAFKQHNTDSILFYAADLGHYIEDATVPLHTTINYDGQLSNQKGIHALWESVVPEIEISNYNLYSTHKATYISNKEAAIWAAVKKANAMLPLVFSKEKEVTKQFTDSTKYRIQIRNGKEVKYYTTAFAKAYSNALGTSINDELIYAANLLSDFWYTAWVDAGKPNLNKLPNATLTKAQKLSLKKELAAYQQNHLVQDSLLYALKKTK